jgi:hypothetical protein
VGGLVFSTLFSLFFVPVLISIGHDVRDAFAARRGPTERPAMAPVRT